VAIGAGLPLQVLIDYRPGLLCRFNNNKLSGVSFMSVLAYGIVSAVGLWLVGSGLYHHLNYRRLKADPVLIGGCYLMGSFCLATCVV
jgi:hypothetical protein